ncbi:hypothetical protein C8034_v009060 [Colletotrichum sidae]|uniref:Uncharacterized protein n=1 Tax=Colletotrichum sidae TaxID=1347389 RepID=A0A4R8T226_9PEZI|nr:hypothetical protein C8034_v009060 [Colletotrichum sidae]
MNFIRIINNYKNCNYFYKGLKRLISYESNFTTFLNSFKMIIIIFNFTILLENKTMNRTRKRRKKQI